jgi:hypothetical protein
MIRSLRKSNKKDFFTGIRNGSRFEIHSVLPECLVIYREHRQIQIGCGLIYLGSELPILVVTADIKYGAVLNHMVIGHYPALAGSTDAKPSTMACSGLTLDASI